MIPIVDMHCHLLAGLDDGPREMAEAIEMCTMLAEQGVGAVHALAHQNEHYPQVTREVVAQAGMLLKDEVRNKRLPVAIFPGSEVMVHPTTLESVDKKLYCTIGSNPFMLIELPHGIFIDLRDTVAGLMERGIRPILAHPEQSQELLFSEHMAEDLIRLGCLFQLSTGNVTMARDRRHAQAIKNWVQRGFVHVIGSDGHSSTRRPPLLAEAAKIIMQWIPGLAANKLCGMNGMAILQGLPLRIEPPQAPRTLFWHLREWAKKVTG
ncbi:MAG: CpsB/CapC family capsule biosynthesis tyrosine phosphatase [Gemmatales bacterium]